MRAVMNNRMCELRTVLVTICKCTTNPITYPNPLFSHTQLRNNMFIFLFRNCAGQCWALPSTNIFRLPVYFSALSSTFVVKTSVVINRGHNNKPCITYNPVNETTSIEASRVSHQNTKIGLVVGWLAICITVSHTLFKQQLNKRGGRTRFNQTLTITASVALQNFRQLVSVVRSNQNYFIKGKVIC